MCKMPSELENLYIFFLILDSKFKGHRTAVLFSVIRFSNDSFNLLYVCSLCYTVLDAHLKLTWDPPNLYETHMIWWDPCEF